jgi:hypothetical protein
MKQQPTRLGLVKTLRKKITLKLGDGKIYRSLRSLSEPYDFVTP